MKKITSASNRTTGSVGERLPIFMTMADPGNEDITTIIGSIQAELLDADAKDLNDISLSPGAQAIAGICIFIVYMINTIEHSPSNVSKESLR